MKLALFVALVLGACSGCGYHAAYGGDPPAYRLTVAGAALRTPHPEALEAALAGARAELARNGVLAPGMGHPRLVLELVRVDELATGIAATPTDRGERPLARGTAVAVTVHGFVEEREGAPPVRDTGDLRRVETVAESGEVLPGAIGSDEALRAAGREAGEAAARRALGMAEPSVEPL